MRFLEQVNPSTQKVDYQMPELQDGGEGVRQQGMSSIFFGREAEMKMS
jgi:hypothetical protein